MKSLDQYFALQQEIFDYFEYVENWRVIPLNDCRDMFWYVTSEGCDGVVRFAETKEILLDDAAGNYYENEIYTQRFLPKWVYRGADYTMICVDTHVDGNKFLSIFSNAKEIKP